MSRSCDFSVGTMKTDAIRPLHPPLLAALPASQPLVSRARTWSAGGAGAGRHTRASSLQLHSFTPNPRLSPSSSAAQASSQAQSTSASLDSSFELLQLSPPTASAAKMHSALDSHESGSPTVTEHSPLNSPLPFHAPLPFALAPLQITSSGDGSLESWNGSASSAKARASATATAATGARTARHQKRRKQQAAARATAQATQVAAQPAIESAVTHGADGDESSTTAEQESAPLTCTLRVEALDEAGADGEEAAKALRCACFRRKRVLIPLAILLALTISFLISLAVLYPVPPSISTRNVDLTNLAWAVRADGSLTANLTLAVQLDMHNSNRYGSFFEDTPIDVVLTDRPNADGSVSDQSVATLLLKADYIGPRSSLALRLSTDIVDTTLSSSSDLLDLARRMTVAARASTHGSVELLGIRVPYVVQTECTAVCSLDLWNLKVAIQEQQCTSNT